MKQGFINFLHFYESAIILYLFVINTIYFVLLLLGFLELLRYRLVQHDREEKSALEVSSLVPPISILAPAYNEAATVCESVRAMLTLRYPEFEVIVINDGSKDDTLQLLIEEFKLYKSARYYEAMLNTKPIRAVYESMNPIRLVVVDKENGGKADALNAGINVARYPLICAVDSDSILEEDALLRIVRPFVTDPGQVLAVGGIVRVANGCGISGGRVEKIDLPESWMGRFQVVEYFRAFLGGRVAFSSFNCLLVISGAFGLFLKSAVVAAGGYETRTVGEDMELIVRLHRWARKLKRKYKILFQPDPVCWTEVPETSHILKRQRNRWQRGTIETVWAHRVMIGNPRYGLLGLFAFPYFVLFEMLGPIVELSGYVLTLAGLLAGLFDWQIALLFFFASVLYGMVLSTASVILEELTMRRYPNVRNLVTLILAGALENLGFRQLLTVWRAQAFLDIFKGNKSWGVMERRGFQKASESMK